MFAGLNEVWADQQLVKLLMSMPLPAMQLLLSVDQLQVDSDTVFYTVSAVYQGDEDLEGGGAPSPKDAAVSALSGVIHYPWLSTCCLSVLVLSTTCLPLVSAYKSQLQQLLSLQLLGMHGIVNRVH